MVKADGRQVVVRACALVIIEDLVRVHGLAQEHVIIGDAQFFRALVEQQEDREGGQADPAAVHHLDGLVGHRVRRFDHGGVDLIGIRGGDDVIRVDLVASLRADAIGLAVPDQDLFDGLSQFDLHAHFFGAFLHL